MTQTPPSAVDQKFRRDQSKPGMTELKHGTSLAQDQVVPPRWLRSHDMFISIQGVKRAGGFDRNPEIRLTVAYSGFNRITEQNQSGKFNIYKYY